MNNAYIMELIRKLDEVEIWEESRKAYEGYDESIQPLMHRFLWHKEHNSHLFFIGNGGSAAIASHMTVDFMKNGGMLTYSLYDPAVITCMSNDYGYEYIFSKPIEFLVQQGDLVVAISSSGNSANIINGIQAAKQKGATVITFTGFLPDNKVKQIGDMNIYIPSESYGMVESIHNLMLQQIVDYIMKKDGVAI